MVASGSKHRILTLLTVLLMTSLVAVLMTSGTALAEEKENGLIYYHWGESIYSIDPTATKPQYSLESNGSTFDISPDRQTLVYGKAYLGPGDVGPFYIFPLSGDPNDPYSDDVKELQITNKRDGTNIVMQYPKFSPDGQTIYFNGSRVLTSDTDDTYNLYSVPTEGGEATKIPINRLNDDGTPMEVVNSDGSRSPRGIYNFALSHDGSKFAIDGPKGVYTVPVSGGVPTRISNDPCTGTGYPSFSPDDQTIAYNASIYSGSNCSGTGHTTIYTTPANGDGTSAGTPLFPGDATDPSPSYALARFYPTYSPDGKFIAFANWSPDTNVPDQLATVPATGGSVKNIANCGFCRPLWIEKLPPDTTITSGPSGTVSDTTASFRFSSDQSGSTFECRLDDNAFESCTSPKDYSNLSDGDHTFEVKATNTAGTDATPATSTWTIDRTPPPDTSIDSGPSGTTNEWPWTFTFSSSQSDSTFECNLNGGPWSGSWDGCQTPWNVGGATIPDGSYTLKVRAINKVGYVDPTPATRTWTLDKTPLPHITYTNPTNGDTDVERTTKPTVTFDTDLDDTTVKPQNVKLQVYSTKKKKWVTVSSTPSYADKVVTVKPANSLGSQKKYRVVLSTSIKSSTDKALEQPYRFTFTTRK